MNFESAEVFHLYTECSSTVSNLSLPNVESLELGTYRTKENHISMSSINAPKLLKFQICNFWSAFCEDINVPSLKKLIFVDTGGPLDESLKTMVNSVKTIVCENTDWWKVKPEVESLKFFGGDSNCKELDSFHFNHLKRFNFSTSFKSAERANLTDYLYPDAPNLEWFRIENSPEYYPFDKFERYKDLKTLSIFENWGADEHVLVALKKLNLSTLTELEIRLCFTDVVTIVDCDFPNLEILNIKRKFEYDYHQIGRSQGRDISQIEVKAPNLKFLSITGLTLGEHFTVSQYRKLKQLKIIGCAKLKSLTVLDAPLLDAFELYSYDQIELHHDGCLKDVQKKIEVHEVEDSYSDYEYREYEPEEDDSEDEF